MRAHLAGLIELGVVFGFALVWAALELIALRYDRKRSSEDAER
jgi:hypothetical protein